MIEIPVDVQQERCRDSFTIPVIEPYGSPDPETADPLHLPRAHAYYIADAAATIAAARRPVILIGPGAARPAENYGSVKTWEVVTDIVERYRVPAAHTFMGKGVVDEAACPYVLPVAGMSQNPLDYDLFNRLFDASDLVITIGYDFHEFDCSVWNRFRGHRPNQQNIINISFLEPQVEPYYAPRHVLTGSIAGNLLHLRERMDEIEGSDRAAFGWRGSVWPEIPGMLREACGRELEQQRHDRSRIGIQDVISSLTRFRQAVREEYNRETIFISDVGLHKMWLARYLAAPRPGSVIVPNGFSAMGYAIPAAVAASFLHRRDEAFQEKMKELNPPAVCAVMGDGCFNMSGMEFSTAVRYGLPIIVCVIKDRQLGLISAKESARFGDRTKETLDLPDIDYAAMARAMGGIGLKVPEHDLDGCLDDAFQETERPTLLEISLDQSAVRFSALKTS